MVKRHGWKSTLLQDFAEKALSADAHKTLAAALGEARDLRSRDVTPSHLLVAFFYTDHDIAKCLKASSSATKLVRRILSSELRRSHTPHIQPVVAQPLRRLVDEAIARADLFGLDRAYPCHLFRALLTDASWSVEIFDLLKRLELDIDELRLAADLMVKIFEPPLVTTAVEQSQTVVGASLATQELAPQKAKQPTDYFSDSARTLFQAAYRFAEEDGDEHIELSHVLRALVEVKDPDVESFLAMNNLRELFARIGLRVVRLLPQTRKRKVSHSTLDFSKETFDILAAAFKESRLYCRELIEARDVLLAILSAYDIGHMLAGYEMSQMSELSKTILVKFREHSARMHDSPIVEDDLGNREIVVTRRTYEALLFAKEYAITSRSSVIMPAHLMLGILKEAELSETVFVQERQADLAELRELLFRRQGFAVDEEAANSDIAHFGAAACQIIRAARSEARRLRIVTVDLHHLTLAFMRTNSDLIFEMSEIAKFNVQALRKRVEFCMLMQHRQSVATTSVILNLSSLDNEIVLESESIIAPIGKAVLGRRDIERMLSQRSEFLISLARDASRYLDLTEVTIETLAIALIEEMSGFHPELFGELGIEPFEVRERLRKSCRKASRRTVAWRDLNEYCWRVLTHAFVIARQWRSTKIEPEHIFLALTNESERLSQFVFHALDIDAMEVRLALLRIIRNQYESNSRALENSTADSPA